MSFLKKLSDQVNDVGKKSKELMEISKLKMQISKLELDRSGKFKELGKNVYISYKKNLDNHDKSIAICEDINAIEKRIHLLEQEVAEKSSEKTECPNCGSYISAEVAFCGQCGQQMKIIEAPAQEKAEEKIIEASVQEKAEELAEDFPEGDEHAEHHSAETEQTRINTPGYDKYSQT